MRCKTIWWLVHINDYDLIEQERIKAEAPDFDPATEPIKAAYRPFYVPKASGGSRLIHAPHARLKELQKAILVRYFEPLPVPDYVGAYIKGRDLKHTSKKHVGAAEMLKLDISDFFNSTQRKWVRAWLRRLGYPEPVVRPLAALITVPIKLDIGHVVGAVPQGAPTSGAVTNHIAIDRIDKPLIGYLETRVGTDGFAYSRYADDLTLSFKKKLDDEDRAAIKQDVIDLIKQSGYRVNYSKVRCVRPDHPSKTHQAMRVLGHSVHTHINVPRKKYRTLRAIVHNAYHNGFEAECIQYGQPTAEAMVRALHGELVYWRDVNPERMEDVWQQFKEAVAKHRNS